MAFAAKALGDIARAKGMTQVARERVCPAKVSIKHFPGNEAQALTQSLKSWARSVGNFTPKPFRKWPGTTTKHLNPI